MQMYQATVVTILNFEVLSPEITTELIWDTSTDYDYVDSLILTGEKTVLSSQIQEVGFETFNPILNVGGLFVMFVITAGSMVLFLPSSLYSFYKSRTSYEGGRPTVMS